MGIVEDIASVRIFEVVYGTVKQGRTVQYPVHTECYERETANELAAAYLRWRLGRKHAARALCCGGSNYIFMDETQPLIKHAECDFGFIEPMFWIGSYCGSGPWGDQPGESSPLHQ